VAVLPFACARWGATGAAVSVVAVTGLNNVVREIYIWIHLRIHPYDRRFWVCFWITGVVGFGLATLARHDLGGTGPITLGALLIFAACMFFTSRYGWLPGMMEGLRSKRRQAPASEVPEEIPL
jgi:hypothetical protein